MLQSLFFHYGDRKQPDIAPTLKRATHRSLSEYLHAAQLWERWNRARGAFWEAFAQRRCVVPADGSYDIGPRTARRPIRYHRKDGGRILFAGLDKSWFPKKNQPQPSAAPVRRICRGVGYESWQIAVHFP